ncbi:putative C-type mannose receptor 2, partial [Hypsibius exemplaris]
AHSGTIAVPQSQEQNNLLVKWSRLALNIVITWIGLQIEKRAPGPLDISTVYFEDNRQMIKANYTNFFYPKINDTLNGLAVGLHHGYLDDGMSNAGKWKLDQERDLSLPRPYACETQPEKCPYGWDDFRDECFQIHEAASDARTWDEANEFCALQGGHLAFAHNAQFVSPLSGHQTGQPPSSQTGKRPFQLRPSETARCAYINRATGKWGHNNCGEPLGLICQAESKDAIFSDIVHPDYECGAPFEKYFDGCYLFVTQATNWDAARDFCLDQRSNLVQIHSAGENAFVKNRMQNDTWIGIRRIDYGPSQGGIVAQFSDGTNMSAQAFSNFETIPTEGFTADKPCYFMLISSGSSQDIGMWKAVRCTINLPFVCHHKGVLTPPRELPELDSAECGRGWVFNDGNCYKIRFEHVQESQAAQTCQNEAPDSSLLYITSAAEQAFVKDMINGRSNYTQEQLQGAGGFWIGMRITNNSRTWYWQYRESTNQWTIPLSYSNWDINEPKDVSIKQWSINFYPEFQGYTYIRADEDAKWVSAPVVERRPYICKKPAHWTPPITTSSSAPSPVILPINVTYGCPTGWTENHDLCYRYVQTPVTWEDASFDCHATERAVLATYHSELQLLTAGLNNYWVGLNSRRSPEHPRIYENTDESPVTYTPWVGVQYANRTGDMDCVATSDGTFRVVSCGEKRPYACMIPLQPMEQITDCVKPVMDPGCKLWGHGHNGKCYYMGHDPRTTFGTRNFETFDGARELCRKHFDADLVVVEDAEEQRFLTVLFAGWAADSWIGLREQEGQWSSFSRWTNGAPVTVTNWAYTEPRQLADGATDRCVALHSLRSGRYLPGDWYTARCTDLKFAVCEGDREGWATTVAPSTAATLAACPLGWKSAAAPSQNCYKAYYAENNMYYKYQRTWRDAETFCVALGGHLASVRMDSEEDAVLRAMSGASSENNYEYWIGLNESPRPGSLIPRWEWADGTPFGTTDNFHPTFDHSTDGILNYDCVVIEAMEGYWIKQSCHLVTGWICEVPKGMYTQGQDISDLELPDGETMNPNETCANGAHPPGDWYHDSRTDRCFFLSSEESSWDNAQAKCLLMSANLATVAAIEQVFVTTLLSFHSFADTQFYIGLRMADSTSGQHEWVDGSTSSNRPWDVGQPSVTGTRACVTMNSRTGKFMDEDCTDRFRFVCLANKNGSPASEPTVGSTVGLASTPTSGPWSPEPTTNEGPTSSKTDATIQSTQELKIEEMVSAHQSKDKIGSGELAGIVVAVLVLCVGVTYAAFLVYRRRAGLRRRRSLRDVAYKRDDDKAPVITYSHEESYT